MNAFTNAILSLLLGWLRALVNAVWSTASDGGGVLFRQLTLHWQTVFLVLCVGGFVVDRVIYVLRWRPYYVWGSRRYHRRMERERRRAGPRVAGDAYAPPPVYTETESPADSYAPPAAYDAPEAVGSADVYASPNAYAQSTVRWQPEPQSASPGGFAPAAYRYEANAQAAAMDEEPTHRMTPVNGYGPDAFASAAETAIPVQPYRPAPPDESFAPTIAYASVPFHAPIDVEPARDEPRFDDDLSPWTQHKEPFEAFAPQTPVRNPRARSERYLRDVDAGFAPPPGPEQLFAPRADAGGAVHPGLDAETFQQSIGLTPSTPAERPTEARAPEERRPAFTPFSSAPRADAPVQQRPRMLGTLAKKARTFVDGEDETNPPTIRDLQSTVDVTHAFHAPVYPKKPPESEE